MHLQSLTAALADAQGDAGLAAVHTSLRHADVSCL
jgi:hypothetical protein